MLKELVPFGTTIRKVLEHRGKAEDWELLSNIAAILMDKEDQHGSESLRTPERYLAAIDAMIRQVNNGGWDQFFTDSSGAFAYDLVPALEAVGSSEFKATAHKAVELFGQIPSLDEDARFDQVERLTEDWELQPWDSCDNEVFGCTENVETLAIDYAIAHLQEFID